MQLNARIARWDHIAICNELEFCLRYPGGERWPGQAIIGDPTAEHGETEKHGQSELLHVRLPSLSTDIRRIRDCFGRFSVPLGRAATKFDSYLTVPGAKSPDWPPRRAGGHCLGC